MKKIKLSLFVLIVFFISFICSRGENGNLYLGIVLHLFLCISMILRSVFTQFKIIEILFYSILYFFSSLLGVLLNSELDEMAGMIIFIYPAFSVLYFLFASITVNFRTKFK